MHLTIFNNDNNFNEALKVTKRIQSDTDTIEKRDCCVFAEFSFF